MIQPGENLVTNGRMDEQTDRRKVSDFIERCPTNVEHPTKLFGAYINIKMDLLQNSQIIEWVHFCNH